MVINSIFTLPIITFIVQVIMLNLNTMTKYLSLRYYYSDLNRLFILSFCCLFVTYILSAIYSVGYYYADEHWQILEFVNYKLGTGIPSDLAWEYHSSMRPGFQPFITYYFIKLANYIGIENRFIILTLLRFLSGFLSFTILFLFFNFYYKQINNVYFKKVLLLFSITLWFLPFYGVRFASENLTAILFWGGVYLFLTKKLDLKISSLIGILFGFAFEIRYQTGFLIFGFYLWWWIYSLRGRITLSLFLSCFCVLLTIALSSLTFDYWLYNKIVFAPFNYFYENLFLNKVSNFGEESVLIFLLEGAQAFILPFGLFIIIFLLYILYVCRSHIFTWCIIPFLVIHSCISHKELRFLFPLIIILPSILALFFIYVEKNNIYTHKVSQFLNNKIFIRCFKIWFVINFILLINKSFLPAHVDYSLQNHFYNQVTQLQTNAYLLVYGRSRPYKISFDSYLTKTFYKPKNLIEKIIDENDELKSAIHILNEWKQQGIKDFYWLFPHTHFYLGNQKPMPKLYWALEFDKKCKLEYSFLENIFIKFNLYRYVRWPKDMLSLYKCSI